MDGRGAAVSDEPSESPQQKIKDRVVHGKLNRAKEIKNYERLLPWQPYP